MASPRSRSQRNSDETVGEDTPKHAADTISIGLDIRRWLVISFIQAFFPHHQIEILGVLGVFCRTGLIISIVFGAQLFLIHQIEQGRLLRRRRDPSIK